MHDVKFAIAAKPQPSHGPTVEQPLQDEELPYAKPNRARAWSVALLSRTWVVLGALLVVAAVFNGLTLLNYPATFVDEGWNASRSLGLLQTGHQFAGVDSGVYQQFEGYWTYWPWLGAAIHAAAIQLLGLSLTTMREVSLLFGLMLLAIVFQIGAGLHNKRTGFMSAGLLSVSLPFLYSSHMARHDIIVAVFGYGAIALQLSEARSVTTGWKGLPIRSLLAGLLVGLSLDIHLNGLLFVPVVGMLYLLDSGHGIFKSRPFWVFVLGLGGGVLFYAAMHILPNPQTYSALSGFGPTGGHTSPLLSLDPGAWLQAVTGTVSHLDLRMLPVIALAGVALVKRGSGSDRKTLLVFAAVVVAYSLVLIYKPFHYAILVAPAAALVVAALLDMVFGTPVRTSPLGFARAVLVVGIVAGTAVSNLWTVWGASNNDYSHAAEKIVQTIPEGASIMAAPTFWFARPYQPYINWQQLETYRAYYSNSNLNDAFNYYRPQYMIMDGFIEYFLVDGPETAQDRLQGKILRSELHTILNERGTLLGQVDTEPYGTVRIYKMNWQP